MVSNSRLGVEGFGLFRRVARLNQERTYRDTYDLTPCQEASYQEAIKRLREMGVSEDRTREAGVSKGLYRWQ